MTSDSNKKHAEPSLPSFSVLALGAVAGLATGFICAMLLIYVGLMGEEKGSSGALAVIFVIVIGLVAWVAKGATSIGGRISLIITCLAGSICGLVSMGIHHLIWNAVEPWSGVGAVIGGAATALIVNKRKSQR